MNLQLELCNQEQTARLARLIAAKLSAVDCITIQGDIGAGKTTLVRYMLQSTMSPSTTIISPSFMLMQQYNIRLATENNAILWHIDGYRLNSDAEIYELGIEELAETSILLIEWPEKFQEFLPVSRLEVNIDITGENSRYVQLAGYGKWQSRLQQLADEFYDRTPAAKN